MAQTHLIGSSPQAQSQLLTHWSQKAKLRKERGHRSIISSSQFIMDMVFRRENEHSDSLIISHMGFFCCFKSPLHSGEHLRKSVLIKSIWMVFCICSFYSHLPVNAIINLNPQVFLLHASKFLYPILSQTAPGPR